MVARRARSSSPSFSATIHGSCSTRYLFTEPISDHATSSARERWYSSKSWLFRDGRERLLLDLIVRRLAGHGGRRIGNRAVEVSRDHGQGAAGQITKIVGKIGVVALHHRIKAEGAIAAENHFTQQEVAQSIVAENVDHTICAHNVAARLGHLA